MSVTFGYMVLCIFKKWSIDYSDDPNLAPSIINIFINFVSKVETPLFGTNEDQLKL